MQRDKAGKCWDGELGCDHELHARTQLHHTPDDVESSWSVKHPATRCRRGDPMTARRGSEYRRVRVDELRTGPTSCGREVAGSNDPFGVDRAYNVSCQSDGQGLMRMLDNGRNKEQQSAVGQLVLA